MSWDFVVIDPTGLHPPPPMEDVHDWVRSLIGDGQEDASALATPLVNELVRWAGERFGTTVGEHSTWASWPPSLLAGGRHCTFTLNEDADALAFMMSLCDRCEALGLLLQDSSGNDTFIVHPGDGELLD